MKVCNVDLSTIDTVREFVNIAGRLSCDVDLISGRYIIDAKSIMGVFSLNLSKPIEVHIHDEKESEMIKNVFSKFIS